MTDAEHKGLLARLQEADEGVKKLWIIAGTAVVMFVIVGAWLTWFNNLDTLAGVPVVATGPASAPAAESGFSFLATVRTGAGALVGRVMGGIRGLGNLLNIPREYIVKPPQ